MATRSNMAALEAEILSRKRARNLSNEDESKPKVLKNSKLHLKSDKFPKSKPEFSETGSVISDANESTSNWSRASQQLERKAQIYDQLKSDPNAQISDHLKNNITLDTSKNSYLIKDKFGRTKQTPVSELPDEFWKNLNSSSDEDETTTHGGGSSYMDSNISQATAHSEGPKYIYDGAGGKFLHRPCIDGILNMEVRHSNTMTEDRRDYGALYINLGIGEERIKMFDTLNQLRNDTINARSKNNVDTELVDKYEQFTPGYAKEYLEDLAFKYDKDLSAIQSRLYSQFID